MAIIEHEMQPIPGLPPGNVVALTMGEAEVIRAALRAALGATATEPRFDAEDVDHMLKSGFLTGYMAADKSGDPVATIWERAEAAFEDTYPAVPVAPSEETEK